MRKMRLNLSLWTCLAIAGTLKGQTVTRATDSNLSLVKKWEWAEQEAGRRDPATPHWIGYSIQRIMPDNSQIGTWYSDTRKNEPSLTELLSGVILNIRVPPDNGLSGSEEIDGFFSIGDQGAQQKQITKDVAILFRVNSTHRTIEKIKMSTLSLHVDLEGYPLFWLGPSDVNESIDLLNARFENEQSTDLKEALVRAVGMHQSSEKVHTFLKSVITGNDHSSVREEAVFWLSEVPGHDALDLLVRTADEDLSKGVREKAVFTISQREDEAGTEALITLARKGASRNVREKALFWLGQKVSSKAVAALEDVATNDEDTEIQKQAIFGLTQQPDGGIDQLISIAKAHANPAVRKQAIFWLGQSGDQRALDALVAIVRKK